jgi:AraC-like DNA-binding protein
MDEFNLNFRYRQEASDEEYRYDHLQRLELVYIHEGQGWAIVNQSKLYLSPGTLLLFQPDQRYLFQLFTDSIQPLLCTMFSLGHAELTKHCALFPSLNAFVQRLWKVDIGGNHFVLSKAEQLRLNALLDGLQERLQLPYGFSIKEEWNIFTIEFIQHLREQIEARQVQITQEKLYSNHVEQMLEWIEKNYRKPISIEKIAESAHLSVYYASHLFSSETGYTLNQYIMNRRLRESRLLLMSTELSTFSIARQIGFKSSAYFCKCFKNKLGVSPQMYRIQTEYSLDRFQPKPGGNDIE